MPFPDNTYAFNFPVKQLNQFNPPEHVRHGRARCATASRRRSWTTIPANGIIDAGTAALRTQAYF